MTNAQADVDLSRIVPEETDPRFVAQHLAAYAFARPFAQGKRVLEVGFGDGYGAHYLAEVAREVTAIDVTASHIPTARQKYPRDNLRFLHMEATRLDFPDASFDVVGSFQVIEHIPEPRLGDYLAEIRRVLTPDGACCLSTLNLAHNMKPGVPYEKLRYHEREFTAPELRELLQRYFPQVELYGLYVTWRHRLYQRLKKWGLMKLGSPAWNPVARFYNRMTADAFRAAPRVSSDALDLIAVCRTMPARP